MRFRVPWFSGLTIAAASRAVLDESRDERRHLERSQHGLGALVVTGRRRTLERLLGSVDRQNSECDRYARLEARSHEAARAFAGNVFEMGRVSANDATERDDGVVAATHAQLARREGQLECARHAGYREILRRAAVLAPGLHRPLEQTRDDEIIEPGCDDGNAPSLRARFAFDGLHAALKLHQRTIRLRDRTPKVRACAWAPIAHACGARRGP